MDYGSANRPAAGLLQISRVNSLFQLDHGCLLCVGDKSTQARDIATAKKLATEWSDQDD